MQIAFLLLSDYSESLNGKLYAMGAGWSVLRFPEFPQEWRFSVGLGIDVAWDETNQRQNIRLAVQDPDGNLLGDEMSMEFETGRPAGLQAGQDQRMVISVNVGAKFEAPGPHAVVASGGEGEIARSRFYVVEAPQNTAQFGGP